MEYRGYIRDSRSAGVPCFVLASFLYHTSSSVLRFSSPRSYQAFHAYGTKYLSFHTVLSFLAAEYARRPAYTLHLCTAGIVGSLREAMKKSMGDGSDNVSSKDYSIPQVSEVEL